MPYHPSTNSRLHAQHFDTPSTNSSCMHNMSTPTQHKRQVTCKFLSYQSLSISAVAHTARYIQHSCTSSTDPKPLPVATAQQERGTNSKAAWCSPAAARGVTTMNCWRVLSSSHTCLHRVLVCTVNMHCLPPSALTPLVLLELSFVREGDAVHTLQGLLSHVSTPEGTRHVGHTDRLVKHAAVQEGEAAEGVGRRAASLCARPMRLRR